MELESHGQFVIVINFFPVAPGTSMAPDRTDPAIPSGPVIAVERGGSGNSARSVPSYPPALERIFQLRLTASSQHGKRQLPIINRNA